MAIENQEDAGPFDAVESPVKKVIIDSIDDDGLDDDGFGGDGLGSDNGIEKKD